MYCVVIMYAILMWLITHSSRLLLDYDDGVHVALYCYTVQVLNKMRVTTKNSANE